MSMTFVYFLLRNAYTCFALKMLAIMNELIPHGGSVLLICLILHTMVKDKFIYTTDCI